VVESNIAGSDTASTLAPFTDHAAAFREDPEVAPGFHPLHPGTGANHLTRLGHDTSQKAE